MASTLTRELALEGLHPNARKFEELMQDIQQSGILSENGHFTSNSNDSVPTLKVQQNLNLDWGYRDRLRRHSGVIPMSSRKLPAFNNEIKGEIVRAIEDNPVVVITGETGCGKTTQIPQFILDYYIEQLKGSLCKIICCQPRKLSAAGVAERVAEERGENIGENSNNNSIGYKIRFDDKSPRRSGSILYCTTGILQNLVARDNSLSFCSHIIIDEVHERRIEVDFLLTILRDLFRNNPECNVRLVLMSATIKPEAFSEYFDNCPIVQLPGFTTHPVEKYMLEDVLDITKYQPTVTLNESNATTAEEIPDKYFPETILQKCDETLDYKLILSLVKHICTKENEGAILIFLPGWEEIHHFRDLIYKDDTLNKPYYKVVVLHSRIPICSQRRVFDPLPNRGMRKIIISTNIAEASVTINDVVYVIDCGFVKVNNFDMETAIESLDLELISKASARQRGGRAGRTRPGKCYHLFTSHRESILEEFQAPEMVHSSLETYSLQVKSLQLGNIENFYEKLMDRPDPEAVKLSIVLLQNLQCLDENENLTPLGSVVGKLPLNPKLGKMLLFGAIFSCLGPILTIVSVLDNDDPFDMPKEQRTVAKEKKKKLANNSMSDHLTFVRAYEEWEKIADGASIANAKLLKKRTEKYCKDNFLSFGSMVTISKHRISFCCYLYRLGFIRCRLPKFCDSNKNSHNEELVKAIVCAGLYPNIAYVHRTPDNEQYYTMEQRVYLRHWSILKICSEFTGNCLVYYKRIKTKKLYLREASLVRPMVLFLFGANIDEITTSDDEEEVIILNDWIKLRSSSESPVLLKEIRKTLLAIIDNIITGCKIIDWESTNTLPSFVNAVVEHISHTKTRSVGTSDFIIAESD